MSCLASLWMGYGAKSRIKKARERIEWYEKSRLHARYWHTRWGGKRRKGGNTNTKQDASGGGLRHNAEQGNEKQKAQKVVIRARGKALWWRGGGEKGEKSFQHHRLC